MMKPMIAASALVAGISALAAPATAESFLKNQAFEEVQRVAAQVEVVQSNQEDLSARVARIESGKGEIGALRSEIDSLKAEIAQLRRELAAQRGEIVNDLTRRIAAASRANPPAPAQPQSRAVGPHIEYIVQSGDTLSLIAQAYGTRVSAIKEMSGLKSDNLRVGQKLMIPKK